MGTLGMLYSMKKTIGALISTANWLTIIIVTPVVVGAYIYRIQREEAMLADKFSEQYEAY
jgi:protein-S-isoprenylcysteine O-methyltransferase Ste14